jgi:hypothetical protein
MEELDSSKNTTLYLAKPAERSGFEQQAEAELLLVPCSRLCAMVHCYGTTPSTCTSQISVKQKDLAAAVHGANAQV